MGNVLVAKLGRDEEETSFEYAEGIGNGHCVKVVDEDVANRFTLPFEGQLVDVTIFALHQKEQHVL